MQMPNEFPAEYWVELPNHPHLLGRITVYSVADSWSVELDLVLKESRKIYRHLAILHQLPDFEESLELGFQRMSELLRAPIH